VMVVLNGERAVVSTLAGGVSGGIPAYVDASAKNAGFNHPYGVAVDASGNVFVADTFNHRIRKVTADGGTRIGPVTLRAVFAVRILMLKNRRERVGHFLSR
jgi:hypothetical protein